MRWFDSPQITETPSRAQKRRENFLVPRRKIENGSPSRKISHSRSTVLILHLYLHRFRTDFDLNRSFQYHFQSSNMSSVNNIKNPSGRICLLGRAPLSTGTCYDHIRDFKFAKFLAEIWLYLALRRRKSSCSPLTQHPLLLPLPLPLRRSPFCIQAWTSASPWRPTSPRLVARR
jgi:hypothetical protein